MRLGQPTKEVREEKPGRNEPCICGKDKKFKKCCIKRWDFYELCLVIMNHRRDVVASNGTVLFKRTERDKLIAEMRAFGMVKK